MIGTYGYVIDITRRPDGRLSVGFYHSMPGVVVAEKNQMVTVQYRGGRTVDWPRDRFQAYSNQAHARMTSGF